MGGFKDKLIKSEVFKMVAIRPTVLNHLMTLKAKKKYLHKKIKNYLRSFLLNNELYVYSQYVRVDTQYCSDVLK